jgi:hypothetical protein
VCVWVTCGVAAPACVQAGCSSTQLTPTWSALTTQLRPHPSHSLRCCPRLPPAVCRPPQWCLRSC